MTAPYKVISGILVNHGSDQSDSGKEKRPHHFLLQRFPTLRLAEDKKIYTSMLVRVLIRNNNTSVIYE